MGFDNECILNIQSLPGEYFCPVCRTLIYPNEALQTQCTHLYCKPCLAYTVATTQACPYDGYLVTEADSKPLMESNKSLAETIGKVTVHCLYHKSGCQWQGKLSDCITHGTTCAYGNSPVVCNRCGTQIVHHQVQEHAQLCPGLQPQTQQADSSLTQSSAATTQAVFQDPSAVASVAPAAAATTVPSATTARAITASAVATSSAVATTASTMAVSPFLAPTAASQGQAVAPQTPTAEQYQQQLQYQQYYQQYYQQHYPGYNPYMQQYQQYGQQYQQYTQPQMQVAPQNVAQAPSQPVPYVQPQVLQPSQPQHVLPSQPQNQPQLPQLQAPVVQPQPQQNPQLQSAPQISQMQPQSQAPLQLPHPQAQPMAHPPAPAQVVSQPFAMPAAQATPPQVQPHVQTHPPQHLQVVAQQQHPQLQHLPQQQHCQPQIQLNYQIQHQHPQVQQQSYPQPQAYHQPHPMPPAQPQNPSVHAVTGHQSFEQPQPAHQMPQGAPLQHPIHVSHQQVVGPQHPALVRPPQGQFPLQGQQPAMLAPQGTQHTPQHLQHVHHSQRPPMQPSIPSQAPQQGFPLNTTVPSQTGQSYQEGMPSSQQQMHSQPFQPHVPPYMQQHHVQTSAGRSMSYVAPPQQFQNQPSGPLKDLHGAGQPIGQGSSALETHASESGKSENATNATGNTEVSDNKYGGVESTVIKSTMSQSLSDKNVNREQNDFGNVRKDAAQTSIALDGADGPDNVKGKGEFASRESNLHGPDVRGDKESKASDTSHHLEKGGSLQQSQQNLGALGSYVPPGMGPQHPSGPDRMLPQHMLHPGSMPYMQGQQNQMRPPKHNFPENIRPPMQQQPYDSYHSEMAPRALAPNQNQMPIPQPATIRPNDGMIRPPMGGPLPGQHDAAGPPFAPEHVCRPHPLGTAKSNGVGGGPHGTSRAFHEEGFNSFQEQFRSFAAYPGRHNVNRNIEENMKQFPMPAHLDGEGLQRGPKLFEGGIGRPDGFADSLHGRPPFPNQPGPYPIGFPEDFARKPHSTVGRPDFVSPVAEFGHHRIDGMPTLRNPGPFLQGMTGGPGGLRKDQLGSGNLPGIVQHDFDSPEFPHTRLHPGDTFVPRNVHGGGEPLGHGQLHGIEPSGYRYHGQMHPDDPNLVIDYSQHGFPKESGYFGSGGHLRNGDVGWCRICKFNCGSAEGLDLHVQTREHQQYAMDIVLKMKHDVARRQKMNSGGPNSFNKKVGGKGNFRGNRR